MGGQLLDIEEIDTTKKSKRVRFTDMINMETQELSSSDDNKSLEDVSMLDEDEGDDDVDFVLSIGEDGELDYSITTTEKMAATLHEQDDDEGMCSKPPLSCQDNYNKKDEVTEEPLLRVNSTDNLETLKISLRACEECSKNDMPTPLITPPSSPQRIRTLSIDGATTEEATICEWPCNLTVDNAITSAVEQHPSFPSSFFTDGDTDGDEIEEIDMCEIV